MPIISKTLINADNLNTTSHTQTCRSRSSELNLSNIISNRNFPSYPFYVHVQLCLLDSHHSTPSEDQKAQIMSEVKRKANKRKKRNYYTQSSTNITLEGYSVIILFDCCGIVLLSLFI